MNRLAAQSSPYLLQHQHNPVDWYAWGPEAFEAARIQNKPIFLSVGYSTCYWCHVMERQSFENGDIAAEMNQRCINIKVDREERSDVDQLYMTFIQLYTQQGGWPMSVFLTPDLKPFHGGTYFPPQDQYGRPGILKIFQAVDEAWRSRPDDVKKAADHFTGLLQRIAAPTVASTRIDINPDLIEKLVNRSVSDYDARHGGFGTAPKFPRQTLLEMLLVYNRYAPDENRLKMLNTTLDALEAGGIRDHLGGGFHRYSTDAQWLVPHFEIMLYDNALLAWVYVEAFAQTAERRYAEVARGILDFVLRELTSPAGAFYTAFDAEVDAQEGLPYLWTAAEIDQLLGDDAALFKEAYGVNRGPNFSDPHHGDGKPDRNILYLPESLQQISRRLRIEPDDLASRLQRSRNTLYEARRQRKQPALDNKIITSWNALMIRALAYAGQVLQEQRYLDAAQVAADFLITRHRGSNGRLLRTGRIEGFLDDYAFLIEALLTLDTAGADDRYKDAAVELTGMMRQLFSDDGAGFFFTALGADDLIVRQKTASDSPLPSGNAVAAMALLQLGDAQGAAKVLEAFADSLDQHPESMSSMLQAAILYLQNHSPLVFAPEPEITDLAQAIPADDPPNVLDLQGEWISATELHLMVTILPDYHLAAHDVGPGMLPTQLTVTGPAAQRVTEIAYPPGQVSQPPHADRAIRVYEGTVRLVVRFNGPVDDLDSISMTLAYQPCTDTACLQAISKQLDVPTK